MVDHQPLLGQPVQLDVEMRQLPIIEHVKIGTFHDYRDILGALTRKNAQSQVGGLFPLLTGRGNHAPHDPLCEVAIPGAVNGHMRPAREQPHGLVIRNEPVVSVPIQDRQVNEIIRSQGP